MEKIYQVTIKNLLRDLDHRRREILERRFGLRTGQGETLQSIGDDLGISRERVRQIIEGSLRYIKEKKARDLEKPIRIILDYFQKNGGLKKEEKVFTEMAPEDYFRGPVFFFLTVGDEFNRFKETEEYYSFWTIEEKAVLRAQKTINVTIQKLEKKREPLPLEELKRITIRTLEERVFLSYIEISKHIAQSPEGLFGLASWPEINPRGLRDKIYLVLKKENKPMHFNEIAQKINNLPFQERQVLPESVHNELIRSPLFVLIGRGIYALREWGYEPGTVKDIIIKILKEAKRPLSKEEILTKVLEQRQVKENTVILNLQDKRHFIKTEQGKYILNS
jgi:DNA-directed RNA polymerase specialized sigma subunit